jgi:hypothetical protein
MSNIVTTTFEDLQSFTPEQEKSVDLWVNDHAELIESAASMRKSQIYLKVINQIPNQEWLSESFGGAGKSLAIVPLLRLLDCVYRGEWSSRVAYQVIGNEITCSVDFWAWLPHNDREIHRGGVASIPIMVDQIPNHLKSLDSDNAEEKERKRVARNTWAINVENKKPEALKTNLPACASMALKNAVRTIGILFGRNIGKKIVINPDEYNLIKTNDENEGVRALTRYLRDMFKKGTLSEEEILIGVPPDSRSFGREILQSFQKKSS